MIMFIVQDIPVQENGHDCGVFLLEVTMCVCVCVC